MWNRKFRANFFHGENGFFAILQRFRLSAFHGSLLNGTYRIQAIRSKIVLFDLVKCASQADSNVIQEKSILLKTKAAAVQFQWRYPFMRTGDGFLSAVRRRMTRSRGELLEQCSAPGPRSIEHCSTLLSNAHWIFKNTPNPSGSFLNRRFYIHVVSFDSFLLYIIINSSSSGF